MKRLILFVVVFFGLYPVLSKGKLCLAGIDQCNAQNNLYHLLWFLEKKDGAKYYYLPANHSCGCAVAQYTNTGEFVQYIYATKQYMKENPAFRAFLDSGGMQLPPNFWEKRKKVSPKKDKLEKDTRQDTPTLPISAMTPVSPQSLSRRRFWKNNNPLAEFAYLCYSTTNRVIAMPKGREESPDSTEQCTG